MTKIFQISTNTAFTMNFVANNVSYRMKVEYNNFNDSYFFSLFRSPGLEPLLSGITMSTGTNLVSQFNWFKLWIVPTKPELYSVNPTANTIRNYQIWVEDEL